MSNSKTMYDFIVVGGGSAGCAAAARLVGAYGAKVLLLEAGIPDRDPLIRMPAGFSRMLRRPDARFIDYESPKQANLGGRNVHILQPKIFGGGSSVNAMTYTRGTQADYDAWDKTLGGAGWKWADLLPYFIRQEGNQRIGLPFHGVSGPLKVSDAHHPPCEISRAFLLALQGAGLDYTPDFNDGDERGAGFIQSTTYHGRRCSAATAFIDPLRSDARLTIKHRCQVTRLLFKNGRAVGVEYVEGGYNVASAYVSQEVLLCAGSFVSPKILMHSGIGPADALEAAGIKVMLDLPGVGKNLQDHHDVGIDVETNANYGYSGEDRGLRLLANGLQYVLYGTGPVASTATEVTAFLDPRNISAPPVVQFYCIPALRTAPGKSSKIPGAILKVNLVRPLSRGSVRIRTNNPIDPLIVDPNWFDEREDVDVVVSGLRFLLKTLTHSPMREKISRIVSPISSDSSDSQLAEYSRRVTGTNWHPVGTCKMGRSDDCDAVVDARLRVRGLDGVRVLDASIMPRIVSANPNAPVMAIAEKGIDQMMEEKI